MQEQKAGPIQLRYWVAELPAVQSKARCGFFLRSDRVLGFAGARARATSVYS